MHDHVTTTTVLFALAAAACLAFGIWSQLHGHDPEAARARVLRHGGTTQQAKDAARRAGTFARWAEPAATAAVALVVLAIAAPPVMASLFDGS